MPDTFYTTITLLNSADEEKRLEGIRLLGTIKEARAAEALIGFVRRESKRTVYLTMKLVRFARPLYYPPIIEDLRRYNHRMLEEAIRALVCIGYPAVTRLAKIVASVNIYAEPMAVELFIWALGEIGNLDALPVLRPFAVKGSWYEGSLRVAAELAVKKIEAANADILDKPIPAAEPQPSAESLPIPAKEPELPTEKLPRPAKESGTD